MSSRPNLLVLPILALGLLSAWPSPDTASGAIARPDDPCTATSAGTEDPESAKSCGECHKEIYDEWHGRVHSKAWVDEIYQAAIKKKKRANSCYGCHIPDRTLEKVGRKPSTRKKLLDEGVTCVSCHEKGGAMHGPFGAKTDAHKSEKNELFIGKGSNQLCLSCHKTKIDVVLPVGKDYVDAGLEENGKTCVECHMEEVTRHIAIDPKTGKPTGEERKGRRHRQLGPNDPEFCAKAFKLEAKKSGSAQEFRLTILNEAGHRVPGLLTREFHFLVRQRDKDGKQLGEEKVVISGENAIKVGETREFPYKLASGAVAVEVSIEHHFMEKRVAEVSKQKFDL